MYYMFTMLLGCESHEKLMTGKPGEEREVDVIEHRCSAGTVLLRTEAGLIFSRIFFLYLSFTLPHLSFKHFPQSVPQTSLTKEKLNLQTKERDEEWHHYGSADHCTVMLQSSQRYIIARKHSTSFNICMLCFIVSFALEVSPQKALKSHYTAQKLNQRPHVAVCPFCVIVWGSWVITSVNTAINKVKMALGTLNWDKWKD